MYPCMCMHGGEVIVHEACNDCKNSFCKRKYIFSSLTDRIEILVYKTTRTYKSGEGMKHIFKTKKYNETKNVSSFDDQKLFQSYQLAITYYMKNRKYF